MTAARLRFVLELAIIVGCFLIILVEQNATTETAAFGLLGVIAASIVKKPEQPQ